MIEFLDGPARGVVLELRRIPTLLRVVQQGKEFDALDQLDDEPRVGEKITVYRRVKQGRVHICNRGRGKRSGWYFTASYRVLQRQPADDQVRTTEAWRQWADCHQPIPDVEQSEP